MIDLTAMIMSMDTLQLAGIGLATMSSIGLIAYGVLKKKPAAETLERPSASDAVLNTNPARMDLYSAEALNTKEELSQLRPRLSETTKAPSFESNSSELLESALVYDGYGSKDEAIEILREAMEQEHHPKEKVRLHVIFKNYNSGNESLSTLISRYPTFLKNQVIVESEQVQNKQEKQFDSFSMKKDSTPIEPVLQSTAEESATKIESPVLEEVMATSAAKTTPIAEEVPVLTETVAEEVPFLTELVSQAKANDSAQEKLDAQDTDKFFQEFGDLAKQIQTENENSQIASQDHSETQKEVFVHAEEKPIHDVWANYMSLFGGRMNLKNSFVHLENAWGTISGIAELQEKINNEIGKDNNGNQIPWAIISVLPLKDVKE